MEADQIAANEVLEPNELVAPADILARIDDLKITHGLYGWWFDAALPDAPRSGCLEFDGKNLLYVGIAPSTPKTSKSGRTLRERMKNHLRGPVGSSTLRFSLTSLLKDELQFDCWRTGRKVRMSRHDEDRLTHWMFEHAHLTVTKCSAPWALEDEIIRLGPTLPLNLRKNKLRNPFYPKLKAIRKALGRD